MPRKLPPTKPLPISSPLRQLLTKLWPKSWLSRSRRLRKPPPINLASRPRLIKP